MTTENVVNESDHYAMDMDKDDEGWWFVLCSCGWRRGGLPDRGIAVDSYSDHRAAVGRLDRAEGRQ